MHCVGGLCVLACKGLEADKQNFAATSQTHVLDIWVTRGLQGVGLQPENLADRLLVKHSQPASQIETNSDKNFENLHES